MIPHPSKKFFRQQLIFGLFVWCVVTIITYTNYDINSVVEADMVSLNNFGTPLSPTVLWILLTILDVAYVVGIIAMIFFKSWGRFLMIARLACECFLTSFMGILVLTGVIDMLLIIEGVLIGIPLVLSFFHPCSEYFTNTNETDKMAKAQ